MRVACALIVNEQGHYLVAQRPHGKSHAGLWEFPGGKLEPGEEASRAMVREVREEVGLEVHAWDFLGTVRHTYPTHDVELLVFHCTEFSGIPQPLEGQPALRWVSGEEMATMAFPEANHAVMRLGIPATYST